MDKECSAFYEKLAMLLAEKGDQPYYQISGYVRTRVSFSLVRSSILCIRGSRSKMDHNIEKVSSIDMVADVDAAKIK